MRSSSVPENSPGRARKIQGRINLRVFRRQTFLGAFMGVGIFEKKISKNLQEFPFFCSIHRGRPRQLYRSWYFPFFGRLPPTSVRSLGGIGSRVFYFTSSLALSRNFLKFSISLRPTRVNFSTASSTTIPHSVEGAALLCGRLPPPFRCLLFDRATSVFSERFFNRLRPKKKNGQNLAKLKIQENSFLAKFAKF